PTGKIKLSRKQALSKEELEAEMAMAPVGAPGEDEGRDEFPRGGHSRSEHRRHFNRDHRPRAPPRRYAASLPNQSCAAPEPRFSFGGGRRRSHTATRTYI